MQSIFSSLLFYPFYSIFYFCRFLLPSPRMPHDAPQIPVFSPGSGNNWHIHITIISHPFSKVNRHKVGTASLIIKAARHLHSSHPRHTRRYLSCRVSRKMIRDIIKTEAENRVVHQTRSHETLHKTRNLWYNRITRTKEELALMPSNRPIAPHFILPIPAGTKGGAL